MLEGDARAAVDIAGVTVVRAAGSGDDEVVAQVAALAATGCTVTAVTSDRELAARLGELGASVQPSAWLRALL